MLQTYFACIFRFFKTQPGSGSPSPEGVIRPSMEENLDEDNTDDDDEDEVDNQPEAIKLLVTRHVCSEIQAATEVTVCNSIITKKNDDDSSSGMLKIMDTEPVDAIKFDQPKC
jgi:hypothetical protein